MWHAVITLSGWMVDMATAQRTRPRAVVGAPRRAAWQLKSASRNSVAPRRVQYSLHFFFLQLMLAKFSLYIQQQLVMM